MHPDAQRPPDRGPAPRHVTSWNRGAERISAIAQKMIGQPWRRLTPADRQDEAYLRLQLRYSQTVQQLETPRLTSDGRLIVAVTSYVVHGDWHKCLEVSAEGYIDKSIDPDTFVDEVEQFLRSAHPRATA